MQRIRAFIYLVCVSSIISISVVQAQGSNALSAAATVPVVGERSAGTLIRFNPSTERYEPTQEADDALLYGVVAALPPVVFVTGTSSVPVVTSGNALVKVQGSVNDFQVGDVLTSAAAVGLAKVATTSDQFAFGFVREVVTSSDGETPSVIAEIDIAAARQALKEARANVTDGGTTEENWSVSYIRGLVAMAVVIGGLIGMVIGTRITLNKAITAVGRNPRARMTIFSLAGVTIVVTFALGLLTILVGVGILVVPL